jgi:hypothetical protein
MIDGQSEQLKIKKAMKIHEIVSSDKESFAECKNDLMKRISMDESEAKDVASSIRDMFLPKLMKSEGLEDDDMPEDFIGKMTDDDDDFENDETIEDHDEEEMEDEEDFDFSDEDEDHEDDALADEHEVDADEIATIHITVPADKIREVEKALETVLGDTDAMSEDQAIDHKEETIGDKKMNKEIEARKALRKTILAAMADDEEVQHVSRKDGFEHAPGQQYFEEQEQNTVKGNLTDPDFSTLDYAANKIPSYLDLEKDKGLKEIDYVKFDGTPEDAQEFTLAFDALAELEIPSQGDQDLYHELEIPSEGKLSLKRTVQSSSLGDFDADAAEEVLAFALKSAGVEDEDLGKLTYAEALSLYKAIKTAEKHEDHKATRVMEETPNNPKEAVTEKELRHHTGTKEIDPEKDHERSGKELYSSADDQYASMLRKLMKGASEHDKEGKEAQEVSVSDGEVNVKAKKDHAKDDHKKEMAKEAELFKARLKTAYAMSTKLATAGLLPAEELDAYAEGMISDGLTVTAMIRQTKLMLNSAATNAERLASSNKATRTASTGISFNPSVRGASADLSGVSEIQNALKNIGWTAPQVTGMED